MLMWHHLKFRQSCAHNVNGKTKWVFHWSFLAMVVELTWALLVVLLMVVKTFLLNYYYFYYYFITLWNYFYWKLFFLMHILLWWKKKEWNLVNQRIDCLIKSNIVFFLRFKYSFFCCGFENPLCQISSHFSLFFQVQT